MAESFVLNTGARIPSVGLGTSQAEPGVVGQAIYAAVKAGYRHIDCAPAYRNEKEIGLALKKLFEDGVVEREDLFITSKLWSGNQAPEDVPEGIDTTLEDLQLDYLDLFLIHSPIRSKKGAIPTPENFLPLDIPGTWGAMEKLYDSGKARAIGVSNFSCKKMEDLLAIARVPPAVNQVESHPGWQQMKLRELCLSKGVHLSAYSPLGKPGSPRVKGPSILSNPIVISVAERLQKTPAQVALRWGLQMGQSVLPKSTNEARIEENLNIFDWSIPEDLMAKFSEMQQIKTLRADFVVHPQGARKDLSTLTKFWNKLIQSYINEERMDKAWEAFNLMQEDGLEPDIVTYNSFIPAYARAGQKEQAYELLSGMVDVGLKPNVVSMNALISGLHHHGLCADALEVFRYMQLSTDGKAKNWTFLDNNNPIQPSGSTITSVFSLLTDLKLDRLGKEVHCYALRNGLMSNIFISSKLVDLYGKTGHMLSAANVFWGITNKNVVTWNSLLAGYKHNRKPEVALKLFREMLQSNFQSNASG